MLISKKKLNLNWNLIWPRVLKERIKIWIFQSRLTWKTRKRRNIHTTEHGAPLSSMQNNQPSLVAKGTSRPSQSLTKQQNNKVFPYELSILPRQLIVVIVIVIVIIILVHDMFMVMISLRTSSKYERDIDQNNIIL